MLIRWAAAGLSERKGGWATQQKTDFHAHHAIQITLALDGRFELLSGERRVGGPVAVVAADARHAFAAEGLVAMLFLPPESRAGRALVGAGFADGPVASLSLDVMGDLPGALAAAFRASPKDDEGLRNLGRAMIARLAEGTEAETLDPRVRRAMDWAAEALDGPAGAAEAARVVGLSPGRLSHLFVEQTGLPFKTYLLWLRMTRAVEAYAAGSSLTEAAHGAGFADSAHFSRTFRRMFGVAAAALKLA